VEEGTLLNPNGCGDEVFIHGQFPLVLPVCLPHVYVQVMCLGWARSRMATDLPRLDHFSEVVVVEPEVLFDGSGYVLPLDVKRKRVLQYGTLHGFQPINLQVLRRFFPTFDQEVKSVGARILPTEYNTHVGGVRIPTPEVCRFY
jgi:hypothetical protein